MAREVRRETLKHRVFEVLEAPRVGDRVAVLVERAIVLLIVVNVLAVVFETVGEYRARFAVLFTAIEVGTVCCFAVEYAARLWVSDLHGSLTRFSPWGARRRYAVSPPAIVDLAAVAPSIVGLAFGIDDINVLVVFRLLRFLKLARYSTGLASLISAVASERRALFACGVVMAGLVVTAAALMHWIEGTVQPDRFGSIPLAMYWAVTTLTTVGYGDFVPITAGGRALAGVVMLFGFCMFALPVGIIATAFAREVHSRDFVVTWSMVAKVPLFGELSAAEIADVMRLLRAQTTESGTLVTTAGEPAHSMYFIASGTVEIRLPHSAVRLTDGAFFGEIAVLRRVKRSADVVAVTPCRLLVLDAEDLQYLMRKNRSIAVRIREVARARIDQARAVPKGDISAGEIAEKDDDGRDPD